MQTWRLSIGTCRMRDPPPAPLPLLAPCPNVTILTIDVATPQAVGRAVYMEAAAHPDGGDAGPAVQSAACGSRLAKRQEQSDPVCPGTCALPSLRGGDGTAPHVVGAAESAPSIAQPGNAAGKGRCRRH